MGGFAQCRGDRTLLGQQCARPTFGRKSPLHDKGLSHMRDPHRASKSRNSRSQEDLIAAMMEPGFYPKPPTQILHKETHISHVFLAGELVYKIKKPVRFSFLDFSTLAKRRHFLLEELRLNRRLSPGIYLSVLPIDFAEGRWRLGTDREAAEYTIVMRRLPERRMLSFLLETKQATAVLLEQLADHLARFHADAEPFREIPLDAHWTASRAMWNENLAELEPLVSTAADRQGLEIIRSYGAEFIRSNRDLFTRRTAGGWIRDVHGDLHAEHICFANEGIQILIALSSAPSCAVAIWHRKSHSS